MPYEFSGLYMFGLPLPALDEEIAKNAAAIQRELALLDAEAPAPREDAPAPLQS